MQSQQSINRICKTKMLLHRFHPAKMILLLLATNTFISSNALVEGLLHPSVFLHSSRTFAPTFMKLSNDHNSKNNDDNLKSKARRALLIAGAGSGAGNWIENIFGDSGYKADAANAEGTSYKSAGATNEVVKVVNGMKRRRLGGSDIVVSELGLGTQRWASADYNAPDKDQCFEFMDEAILKNGVNLLDTAEQYPIPSAASNPEGYTETVIGEWMKSRKVPRSDVVIASKITGGRYVCLYVRFLFSIAPC